MNSFPDLFFHKIKFWENAIKRLVVTLKLISQVCGLRPRVDFISGVATPPGCLDQRKVFPGVAGASDRDCRLLDGADRQHGGSPAIVGERQLRHRASQDGDSESQVSRESCCCIFVSRKFLSIIPEHRRKNSANTVHSKYFGMSKTQMSKIRCNVELTKTSWIAES